MASPTHGRSLLPRPGKNVRGLGLVHVKELPIWADKPPGLQFAPREPTQDSFHATH